MGEYSQGVCQDGAAILCDGKQLTIEEILSRLRENEQLKKVDVKQLLIDWNNCSEDEGFEGDHPILSLAKDVDFLREQNEQLKKQLDN